jgi:hypothetical protein
MDSSTNYIAKTSMRKATQMKLSLKKSTTVPEFVMMTIFCILAGGSFIYILHACFYQWNAIMQVATIENIQKPLIDFMMYFFGSTIVVTAIIAILFGLLLTFTVSLIQVAKHANDDDLAGLV